MSLKVSSQFVDIILYYDSRERVTAENDLQIQLQHSQIKYMSARSSFQIDGSNLQYVTDMKMSHNKDQLFA